MVDFYNGEDIIKGLVIWPRRDSGDLPYFTGTMNKMSFGVLDVAPKMYKGTRRTGQVLNWSKISG